MKGDQRLRKSIYGFFFSSLKDSHALVAAMTDTTPTTAAIHR